MVSSTERNYYLLAVGAGDTPLHGDFFVYFRGLPQIFGSKYCESMQAVGKSGWVS